jgi:CheY-like chemotaxis protein
LQFEIADTGIGMTAEQLDRVFEPFTQADASMTRMYGGTGLGLSISRRLAEMLGGTIGAASIPGQGSTFTLTLPTGSLAGVPMVETFPQAFAGAGRLDDLARNAPDPEALCGLRILVAEDDVVNQTLIRQMLCKAGADVAHVENGELAVNAALNAVARGEPFDAILMDMQMPVLDGYDAVGCLRRLEYELPVIAVTAHAMNDDRAECLAAGCDEFVTKPVNRRVLIAAILHVVHARSQVKASGKTAG